MALTPEDVVNKRFQPTKFREGYDQDEVDDFLDEVVAELRRLGQENDELRQRLSSGESLRDEPVAAAAPAWPAHRPPRRLRRPPRLPTPAEPDACARSRLPSPSSRPRRPCAGRRRRRAARAYAAPEADETSEHQQPAAARSPSARRARPRGCREARRAHRRGPRHRRPLVAEAEATPARGRSPSRRGRKSARDRRCRDRAPSSARRSDTLDTERIGLEHRIDDLRTFEREYRQKLKSYIEGQLRELDGDAPTSAGEPACGGVSAPASAQGFGSN